MIDKKSINLHLAALSASLVAQFITLIIVFNSAIPEFDQVPPWFSFLNYAGDFARFVLAIVVLVLLLRLPRLPDYYQRLLDATGGYRYRPAAIGQWLAYALLFALTSRVFDPQTDIAQISTLTVAAWMLAIMLTGGLWLLGAAPLRFWTMICRKEAGAILAAVLVAAVGWLIYANFETLWAPVTDLTFVLSTSLLQIIYPDLTVHAATKTLGTGQFYVNIVLECAGYEGIGLVLIFTTLYLAIYRDNFRFPQVLWLYPLGIATIWSFNILRIVVIVVLGVSGSADVAMGGFHNQAGWISFSLVTLALLFIAYRIPYFNKNDVKARVVGLNLPMALLLPFIVLMAATILTLAMSAGFDWAYPLRVIAVAVAIGLGWRLFALGAPQFRWHSIAAGFLVFLVWLWLVPNNATQNDIFATELGSGSALVVSAWLLFRILGAVITVPIAEELLFRGYLLSRLAGVDIKLLGKLDFSWLAFLGSSLLFGLLHGDWFAGILAGLVYAALRYRGNLWDAIVAHGCTNLCLCFYVLITGHWSMW
ncbi:MAG: exosortase E/protease (VPEID-CTERM system) [Gammaproteobacteria bacterium]